MKEEEEKGTIQSCHVDTCTVTVGAVISSVSDSSGPITEKHKHGSY